MKVTAPAAGVLGFIRSSPHAGFTGGSAPEAIVLEDAHQVDAAPLGLHVQPDVRDRPAELRLRSHRPMAFDAPATAIARIPGGLVDARSFAVFLPSGEYLTESVRSLKSLEGAGYRSEGGVLVREDVDVESRPGTAIVVGNPTHRNWFHWWVESVARLAVVKPFVRGGERFLVPPLRDWQREALALSGLPADLLEVVDGERLLGYDEVLAPSRGIGAINNYSPAALRALRTACAPWPTGTAARIYISRRGARQRRIREEARVEEVMVSHGFTVMQAEALPIREQIDRFSQASVIAGTHGAGLTNMLWAPPGSLVLELQAEGGDLGAATVYWHMSAALGHRYSACICAAVDESPRSDLLVDTAHLDALLQSLLPGQGTDSTSARHAINASAR